jgi:hypothetical protein
MGILKNTNISKQTLTLDLQMFFLFFMFSYLQNPLFLHFWGIFLVLECSEVVA